jgi:hypothetical protein
MMSKPETTVEEQAMDQEVELTETELSEANGGIGEEFEKAMKEIFCR